jgi:ribose 5-phosphate isomerase B
MKIYIASDHAGYELKEKLKPYIASLGNYEVEDLGPKEYHETDDYPDLCAPVARAVSENWKSITEGDLEKEKTATHAIVIGGSSIGEAIVANRYKRVRAVGYYGGPIDIIKLSRLHNDTNVLSLGARLINPEEAMYAVKIWLTTEFTGEERHVRRINKLEALT